jgi:putative transposase
LSRLGNEGRKALNHINVEDVRKAIKELGKKVLRETRDGRVAIDFHAIPQG